MKVVTIVGARPQFVKASVVSKALRSAGHTEILVNTGQHYDDNMAKIFFEEMHIPKADFNLGVGSGSHAVQTAASMIGIEKIIEEVKPDFVIVYGDTNATLAGALAVKKLNLKLVHIEAGLRSFNRDMPEEINRIVTDVLSDQLFVPTQVAADNLKKEGIERGVYVVGDVMVDALQTYSRIAEQKSTILKQFGIKTDKYLLLTIHRPSNSDVNRLRPILEQVSKAKIPVIFPVHPRVKSKVADLTQDISGSIILIDPVGYLDMMVLEKHAKVILTDSGGIQKEAYCHQRYCLTIRSETEWVETVNDGWNYLVGDELDRIPELIAHFPTPIRWLNHYGDGHAANRIVSILSEIYGNQAE
ncbi:MAG: UDP-N-acetylglucosamine 2-epimerase (non-hydrolyzing) [Candidatus Marinimicrobia bacterium]|nr:UDP-N-acetylglucosamine 2-epimerase (non-hydrolyzing) [Candidatus Neomarinimicrobiota bacterium]